MLTCIRCLPLKKTPHAHDKLCRLFGGATPSKTRFKLIPTVTLSRLLRAEVTLWRGRLKNLIKNTNLRRLLGNITCSKLWLKNSPHAKLRRLLGKVTRSRLRPKPLPNVKLWRLLGSVTPLRLWPKLSKNVKLWRLLERVTSSSFRFKPPPMVKVRRLSGSATCSRLLLKCWPMSSSEDCLVGPLVVDSG